MATFNDLLMPRSDFAFRFLTENGIQVDALTAFLQQAAKVARRNGGDLAVVGVSEGSVLVKLRVIASPLAKEFKKSPLATTGAAVGIAGAIIGAIVATMGSGSSNPPPIAKAGAELVSQHGVQNIQIITNNQTIVVMDENRASRINNLQKNQRPKSSAVSSQISKTGGAAFPRMIAEARQGQLLGEVVSVEGVLHFRLNDFKFIVPIVEGSHRFIKLHPGQRIAVKGELVLKGDYPDHIVIMDYFEQ